MQHILIVEDDKGRRVVVLDSTVYSIGRDDLCDIKLNSQFVSRRHAMLVQLLNDNGTDYYRIVDGNLKGKSSANGLLINGRKLQSYDLEHEDEVVFGPQVRCLYGVDQLSIHGMISSVHKCGASTIELANLATTNSAGKISHPQTQMRLPLVILTPSRPVLVLRHYQIKV